MGSIFDEGCAPCSALQKEEPACPERTATDWFRLLTEAVAEFLGTLMFTVFGSLAVDAAYGNGIALTVVVFCTLTVSGGRLNPCVSFAICVAKLYAGDGHATTSLLHALAETIVQVAGAFVGALVARALATGVACPSCCFAPPPGVPNAVVFGHEAMGTFLLVTTVLAVAVDRTGHEYNHRSQFMVVAPLAVGFALYVAANAAGPYTGGAMNPARLMGSVVAGCHATWGSVGAYVGGEYVGAVGAILMHIARDEVRTVYEKHNSAIIAAQGGACEKKGVVWSMKLH